MEKIIRVLLLLAVVLGAAAIISALAGVAWSKRLHWLWHMIREIGRQQFGYSW